MASRKRTCRVMLLDLENVPNELSRLAGEISKFHKVIACHGVAQPKLSLDVAKQLAPVIHDGRLEFVGMVRGGKNAADFGIAFLAGKLMIELPPETEFVILSKDTGLDHVADMLRRFGRKAKRVAGLSQPKQVKVAGKTASAAKVASKKTSAATDFCELHLARHLDRPRSKATLLNAIGHFFRGRRRKVDVDSVLRQLIQLGVVKLDENDRVRYQVRSPKPLAQDTLPIPEPDEAADFAEVDTVPFETNRVDSQKTFQWHSR